MAVAGKPRPRVGARRGYNRLVTRGKVVFAFFGYPGAGKSTLCARFGELNDVPSIDTDALMTADERLAAEAGRYTQAMRLANIVRYGARVRELLRTQECVALADGLPNAAARDCLRRELPGATVVFVLVRTPRELWEQRLSARAGAPVSIGVPAADAYIGQHWEELPAGWEHEAVDNGADAGATDAALSALFLRHVAPSGS